MPKQTKLTHGSINKKKITSKDLKASSPDYKKVVEPFYREEAAKTIQSSVRRTIAKRNGDGNKLEKYLPRQLTEFEENEFNEHIKSCVSDCRYADIDYTHPHFIHHLFSALRKGDINMNEMLTAKLMYESLIAFNCGQLPVAEKIQFKEYKLSDINGPYNPSDITYWGLEEEKKLQEKLSNAEDNKKLLYYIINFQRPQTALYLYYAIKNNQLDSKTLNILKNYLNSCEFAGSSQLHSLKEQILTWIDNVEEGNIENNDVDEQSLAKIAQTILFLQGENIKELLNNETERGSICFLESLMRVGSLQVPSICISPDYDIHNPATAVMSFVLPTIETLNVLQTIVHGEETVLPEAVLGQVTTRMIRAYDDIPAAKRADSELQYLRNANKLLHLLYPTAARLQLPSRPIELTHPDVDKTSRPHEVQCYDFWLSWHDILHAWRSGSNYKLLIRQLRNLHDDKAGFAVKKYGMTNPMSKAVWLLTDLDSSAGRFIRESEEEDKSWKTELALDAILILGGFDFSQQKDDNYLLSYSLCKSPEDWGLLLSNRDSLEDLNVAIVNMETYLNNHPNASVVQVILHDLLKPAEPDDDALLTELNLIGFEKFFYWTSNHGLYLNKETLKIFPSADKVLRNNNPDTIRAIAHSIYESEKEDKNNQKHGL